MLEALIFLFPSIRLFSYKHISFCYDIVLAYNFPILLEQMDWIREAARHRSYILLQL